MPSQPGGSYQISHMELIVVLYNLTGWLVNRAQPGFLLPYLPPDLTQRVPTPVRYVSLYMAIPVKYGPSTLDPLTAKFGYRYRV